MSQHSTSHPASSLRSTARKGAAEVRTEWAAALNRLHDLVQRNLPLATDDTGFIYALQATLAFENGGVWQRRLDHVADGELPLQCPHCEEFLLLSLEGPEYLPVNHSDAAVAPTPVQRAADAFA